MCTIHLSGGEKSLLGLTGPPLLDMYISIDMCACAHVFCTQAGAQISCVHVAMMTVVSMGICPFCSGRCSLWASVMAPAIPTQSSLTECQGGEISTNTRTRMLQKAFGKMSSRGKMPWTGGMNERREQSFCWGHMACHAWPLWPYRHHPCPLQGLWGLGGHWQLFWLHVLSQLLPLCRKKVYNRSHRILQ